MQNVTKFKTWMSVLAISSASGFLLSACTGMQTADGGFSTTRGFTQLAQDKSIKSAVEDNLFKLDTRYKYSHIDVVSMFNQVLLIGQVPDVNMKKMAESRAKAVDGVQSVHNYLTVGDNLSFEALQIDDSICKGAQQVVDGKLGLYQKNIQLACEDKVLYIVGRLNKEDYSTLIQTLESVNIKSLQKVVALVDIIPS